MLRCRCHAIVCLLLPLFDAAIYAIITMMPPLLTLIRSRCRLLRADIAPRERRAPRRMPANFRHAFHGHAVFDHTDCIFDATFALFSPLLIYHAAAMPIFFIFNIHYSFRPPRRPIISPLHARMRAHCCKAFSQRAARHSVCGSLTQMHILHSAAASLPLLFTQRHAAARALPFTVCAMMP